MRSSEDLTKLSIRFSTDVGLTLEVTDHLSKNLRFHMVLGIRNTQILMLATTCSSGFVVVAVVTERKTSVFCKGCK